jgi:hypothetical protein
MTASTAPLFSSVVVVVVVVVVAVVLLLVVVAEGVADIVIIARIVTCNALKNNVGFAEEKKRLIII